MIISDLPIVLYKDLRFGDVINFYPPMPLDWYNLPRQFIQRYQERKYPGFGPNVWEPTHTAVYLLNGNIFEVTTPRARIGQMEFECGFTYTISRYTGCDFQDDTTIIDKGTFYSVAREIDGTMYDYGQLIDILIKDLFGFVPEHLSIFDLGRKNKVCSVGVHACYYKWWRTWGWLEHRPKPLGDQYLEVTTCADFIWPHETFKTVARLQEG